MSEALSSLFGGKPKKPLTVKPTIEIKPDQAHLERQNVLKELTKRRRATMTSELSQARIGKKTLGAGI